MDRVLVVDDDVHGRYYVEALLRASGYDVITAGNGLEALAAAEQTPPQLVLTDVLMPYMDGFALCRRWTSDERFRAIPFIFYTATYTDVRDEAFALSLGAERFMRKPTDPDRLLRVVSDVLESHRSSLGASTPSKSEAFFKDYNEVLVRKLEKKVSELEGVRGQLEQRLLQLQQSQEQLLQSQKMEVIGRLAGGVAHDFNNMLTAVLGATEVAEWRLRKGQAAGEQLEQIRQACQRAAALTKQLLTVSRKQAISPTVNDLRQIVSGLALLLERVLGAGTELRVVASESPLPVLADRGQLEQVVLNLAINARDAMEGRGLLGITTRLEQVTDGTARRLGLPAGRYALLSVSDTGVGISAEARQHIFEPFFTTKGEGGSGLGLSTVHGIVAQSGGAIGVDSAPGHGARFDVYLPLTDLTIERPEVQSVAGSRSETILLVDEDRHLLDVVSEWLKGAGYQVWTADGADEARRLASAHTPHLLLADVFLSGTSGTALALELQVRAPEMATVLGSGHLAPGLLAAGDLPSRFIAKPYQQEALMREIRGALDARRSSTAGQPS